MWNVVLRSGTPKTEGAFTPTTSQTKVRGRESLRFESSVLRSRFAVHGQRVNADLQIFQNTASSVVDVGWSSSSTEYTYRACLRRREGRCTQA